MTSYLEDAGDFQLVEDRDEDVSGDRHHEAVTKRDYHVLRSINVDLSRCPQKSDGRHEARKERQRHRK